MGNPKLIISTAIAIGAILSAGAATAADLAARPYTKAPITAPAAVYDWTGFYVGGNAGYGWQDDSAVTVTPADQVAAFLINSDPTTFTPVSPPVSFKIAGALVGVQAGYNWQFNQRWLVGVETDFNFSDIKGGGLSNSGASNRPFRSIADEQLKWFGTVRARLGLLATPSILIYGTGGFAYGRIEQNAHFQLARSTFPFSAGVGNDGVTCPPGFVDCYVGSSSRTAAGWTAGGGLEYAIGKNWTVKAEYLYVNLGSNVFSQRAIAFSGTQSTLATGFSDTTFHTVRAGINYKFDGPIVAKY